MSTSMRRPLSAALALAEQFKNLVIPNVTCERFEFAGSIRRQKPDIGDVDICVIPRVVAAPSGDMFGTVEHVNALWQRVDDLVKLGTFAKHVKDTSVGERTKWGASSRAIEFRGMCFEIQCCDRNNWALWLIVRTGPAELSQEVVSRLKRYGYASRDGFYVYDMNTPPKPRMIEGITEEQIFKICGLENRPPEKR